MKYLKIVFFKLTNNAFINPILILLKKDDFIKKYINNWKVIKFNKTKSLQENVGFSHRPQIQEAIDSFHLKIKNFVGDAKFKSGSNVLDIGCGTGLYLKDFDQKLYNLYGTDLNSDFISEAKGIIPNGTFFLGDFLEIEIETKFDLILCISVIEYVSPSKLNLFFKKVSNQLKPGGYFILQYPHAVSFMDLLIPDLSYVNYSPPKLQKQSEKHLKTIIHEHFLDGRKINNGYDNLCYDKELGKSFRNGYWLVAKKEE